MKVEFPWKCMVLGDSGSIDAYAMGLNNGFTNEAEAIAYVTTKAKEGGRQWAVLKMVGYTQPPVPPAEFVRL